MTIYQFCFALFLSETLCCFDLMLPLPTIIPFNIILFQKSKGHKHNWFNIWSDNGYLPFLRKRMTNYVWLFVFIVVFSDSSAASGPSDLTGDRTVIRNWPVKPPVMVMCLETLILHVGIDVWTHVNVVWLVVRSQFS